MATKPKVVLLCGGQGTRMREETEFRPKPMVEVGGRPLVWHIMKHFASHGLDEFVLCLGYRGAMIKEYFLNYRPLNSDLTLDLGTGQVAYETDRPESWRITLADTGEDAMTGARVKRVERYLGDADIFLCTYGDGLADVDARGLVDFHRSHGKLATVTGVLPPGRFGHLGLEGDAVRDFAEKPEEGQGRINGGFFVFSRAFLDRLSPDASTVLEREPLERVAEEDELRVYRHDGFWQCADTLRDVELLRSLWNEGDAPWRTWDDRTRDRHLPGDRRGLDHAGHEHDGDGAAGETTPSPGDVRASGRRG
ncbi:MAG: glucose-phosphate cytidylyltransferase [Solirubrobacteraceae bacterium]|jgi:glucose-1-phosphate cytidylyltransferase|nr:glucose-phosphate cytidylyltransferase [Solirubrobacteraceae bacterium]